MDGRPQHSGDLLDLGPIGRNAQGEQQMAGSPTFTEEGAGPYNIQVQQFDGFGPMYDDSWDQ